MRSFQDYPYSPFREALYSMAGRLGLVTASIILASMLAGITASREIWGAMTGLILLPATLPASLFLNVGLFVLPFVILFACVFASSEWPLRMVDVCVILMRWNLHGTMRWMMHDNPHLKERQKLQQEAERMLKTMPSPQVTAAGTTR